VVVLYLVGSLLPFSCDIFVHGGKGSAAVTCSLLLHSNDDTIFL